MKRAVWSLIACAALGANAGETAVARIVEVSGNVLVSDASSMASAGGMLRLAAGMRVLATLNSSAVVEYANGCRVKVAAGERLEIQAAPPCARRGGNPWTLASLAGAPK